MPVRPTTRTRVLLVAWLPLLALPGVVSAQDPSSPAGDTWFDGLTTGVCYELTLDGQNNVDFSVPPTIVDCAQPHANEVAGTVDLGDGDLPADVDRLAFEGCDAVVTAYLGRPISGLSALLFPFTAWPEPSDWASGVREAVCSVAGYGLIGSIAGGTLTAPGETLAAFWQESESAENPPAGRRHRGIHPGRDGRRDHRAARAALVVGGRRIAPVRSAARRGRHGPVRGGCGR